MSKEKKPKKKKNKPGKAQAKQSNAASPCKSINTSLTPSKKVKSKTARGSCSSGSRKSNKLFNTEISSRHDRDFDHSVAEHLASCKAHQKLFFESVRKRRFVSTDIRDFKALLGQGYLHADHMPSSDQKLRNIMGKLLINEMRELYSRIEADPSLSAYHVTFVGDRYMFNERGGTAEVFKLRQAVQAALGSYTSFSAIGVIENQAIINFPENQDGKSLSVHAHVLCWGTKNDISNLKKRAKSFKSSITKLPIHSCKVYESEGSFGKLIRYLMKPPSEGKEVNFSKMQAGEACLSSARRMELYHHFRLLEYSAKLPMENVLFGVREGVEIRNRVVSEMKRWHKNRKGNEIELGRSVYPMFENFLRDNKRLKNYKPIIVAHQRGGGCRGNPLS